MSVTRRLYFGGSFNPIHHGHLLCARAVAELRGYDRVILVPSAQPPHKPEGVDIAPADDRLAMCRLAVAGAEGFEVDDLELRRPGPSYTIDTARELTARNGARVAWLIGADTLPQLPTWHEPEALLQEVEFVIMARPGFAIHWTKVPPGSQKLQANVVAVGQIDISATGIRQRVAAGRPIDYLTPASVISYIRERGLYRNGGG